MVRAEVEGIIECLFVNINPFSKKRPDSKCIFNFTGQVQSCNKDLIPFNT